MARTIELCLLILMVPYLIESFQAKDNNGSSSKNKILRNDQTKEASCICLEEKCGKISHNFLCLFEISLNQSLRNPY